MTMRIKMAGETERERVKCHLKVNVYTDKGWAKKKENLYSLEEKEGDGHRKEGESGRRKRGHQPHQCLMARNEPEQHPLTDSLCVHCCSLFSLSRSLTLSLLTHTQTSTIESRASVLQLN